MDCVGILDSGVGGISTLSTIISLIRDENFLYIRDKSFLPYGNKTAKDILRRVCYLADYLVNRGAKAVVIACNTATSCCITRLRELFKDTIFVGVEPAIKPACIELRQGKVLALVTPLTSKQDKFLQLKSQFNNKIIVSVQPNLAQLIENNINNLSILTDYVRQIYCNYKHENIESIVLGCTHYCLIKHQFKSIFNVKVYDSNSGTASRLYSQLQSSQKLSRTGGVVEFITM